MTRSLLLRHSRGFVPGSPASTCSTRPSSGRVTSISLLSGSPGQVRRSVGHLLDVAGCGVEQLVGQVGERARDGQFVPDLGNLGVARVAPRRAYAFEAGFVGVVQARLRARLAFLDVLVDEDVHSPLLAGHRNASRSVAVGAIDTSYPYRATTP